MEWINIQKLSRKSCNGNNKQSSKPISLLVSGSRRVLLRPETRTWPELHPEPCHIAVKTLPPVPSRYVKAKKRKPPPPKIKITSAIGEQVNKDVNAVVQDDLDDNFEEDLDDNDMDKDVKSVVADGSPRWWKPSSGYRGSPSSVFVRIASKLGKGDDHKESTETTAKTKALSLFKEVKSHKRRNTVVLDLRPTASKEDKARRLEKVNKVHKFQIMSSKFVELEKEKKRKGKRLIKSIVEKMKPAKPEDNESDADKEDLNVQDEEKEVLLRPASGAQGDAAETTKEEGPKSKRKPKRTPSFSSKLEEAIEEACKETEEGMEVLRCRDRMRSKGTDAKLHVLCQGLLHPSECNAILFRASRLISECDIKDYKRCHEKKPKRDENDDQKNEVKRKLR